MRTYILIDDAQASKLTATDETSSEKVPRNPIGRLGAGRRDRLLPAETRARRPPGKATRRAGRIAGCTFNFRHSQKKATSSEEKPASHSIRSDSRANDCFKSGSMSATAFSSASIKATLRPKAAQYSTSTTSRDMTLGRCRKHSTESSRHSIRPQKRTRAMHTRPGLPSARRAASATFLHVGNERLQYREIVARVISLERAKYEPDEIVIEDASTGSTLLVEEAVLKNGFAKITSVKPEGDKVGRANKVTGMTANHLVYLPDDGLEHPWQNAFTLQLGRFPETPFADMVDAFVHALSVLKPDFNSMAWIMDETGMHFSDPTLQESWDAQTARRPVTRTEGSIRTGERIARDAR